jgi:methionine synthase II (cobalamin-independent)
MNETAKEIFDMLDEELKRLKAEHIKRIQYDKKDFYQGKVFATDEIAWYVRTVLKPKFENKDE